MVLLSHAGCPYICGYIWSGYAGTTTVRGVNFASLQVDRVSSVRRRIKISTIRRLLSLSRAANLRRILHGFARYMREQWRWHGSTFLNIGYSKA